MTGKEAKPQERTKLLAASYHKSRKNRKAQTERQKEEKRNARKGRQRETQEGQKEGQRIEDQKDRKIEARDNNLDVTSCSQNRS